MTIATESGHWYAKDGSPVYTVKAKDGSDRATTLRDARKLDLVPSVTSIARILAKPALDDWKAKQVLLAALTLQRLPDEPDEAFCARVMLDSREQAKKAAERGSELHGAIEKAILGHPIPDDWGTHVAANFTACRNNGLDLSTGKPEHSFSHPDGFGGKLDWHSESAIVDFKSKQSIEDEKKLAYDEHAMQLAAYRYGLGLHAADCYNVFIGVEDCKVVVHKWDESDLQTGLGVFKHALAIWKLQRGIQ